MAKKKEKIKKLEKETQKSDFWQNKERAIKITQELSELEAEIANFNKLKTELTQMEAKRRDKSLLYPSLRLGQVKKRTKSSSPTELAELSTEKEVKVGDEAKASSSPFANARVFEKKLREEELRVFLSGEYDKNNAILSISAGAGGQDAMDFATMLLRMYERYGQRKGYQAVVLHQSFGEGGGPEGRIGTKQVSLEIKGNYPYGFFKKETGVHRLVRISPFSAQSLRHTSFALVEVIPVISKEEEVEIKIKPEDLKLETFRASGPGGQYVNRRETAVRITHRPTGIKVACQSERLQGLNREKAMKILVAKLYQLREKKATKELKEIKGEQVSASWGNQIRSYVLHPYRLVKDLRTGVETSDVEAVLDGDLDKFIEEQVFAEQKRR